MAVSSIPLDLSAESTDGTTIELLWDPPEDNGGNTITGYRIERNVNGGVFSTLVGDTGNSNTTYTDSTVTIQNNYGYRVSAINASGVSLPSDVGYATTSSSEAQTIKDLLFNEWSLTGELSKTVTGEMNEVVNFFDRGQIPGNKKAKAVTVQKINALGNENIIEHPTFLEQSDTFEITCFLQVPDGADDVFSVWVDLMQQMTSEVSRILKTVYSPSNGVGEFFRAVTNWTRDDTFYPDDPELTRTLRFTLTRILSNDDSVYVGYPDDITDVDDVLGVLVFDTSLSQGDSKPGSDYAFVQVRRVQRNEGWTQIPYLTNDVTKGIGVPLYSRGMFSGNFSAIMYAKKDDILGSTIEKIANIYKPQSNSPIANQNAEVVFLQNNVNNESPKTVLEVTSFLKVNNVQAISDVENLLEYSIQGILTRPSLYAEVT